MTETSAPPAAPQPAPAPPPRGLPDIPGPLETLARTWRALRRMSTALWLLLALAMATVVATFIPQEPVIPTTVIEWREGVTGPGEQVAAVFDALGLFDVFGSAWFMALTLLLIVSLTGCLIPRGRGFWRTARRDPVPGRNLDRLQHRVALPTGLAPEAALDAAERVLRRRRLRVRRVAADVSPTGRAQVAAERGHWREGGSILFHLSFYVLLAGAVIGHSFGFTGQVNVVEGGSFADTPLSYLGGAQPGRFFTQDDHPGFTVRLDDFDVRYFADPEAEARGQTGLVPRDFVSRVTILDGGEEVASDEIRVNHPIEHDGMKLYQIRFGFAPRLVVSSAGGAELYADAVQLIDAGGFAWTGVAKVAAFDVENQIALELVLLPDADFNDQGMPISRTPEARNPRLAVVLWYGELGLERNIPPREFDRESGRRLAQPLILAPGESGTFEEIGLTVEFPELPYWSGFQVSAEPGRGLLLLGSGLLLAGLLPSLYAYRRRLWVDVRTDAEGTSAVLAGVALQRKQTFSEHFDRLAEELAEALDAPAPAPTASPRKEP
jgi:cytochrome c biogenesis protein